MLFVSADSLKPALCEVAYSYNPAKPMDTLRYGESAPAGIIFMRAAAVGRLLTTLMWAT